MLAPLTWPTSRRGALRDAGADFGDRVVGDAEQNGAGSVDSFVAAGEPHVDPRQLGRLGERTADAPTPDDNQRLGGAQGGGDVIPFQFPHRRYQTAVVAMDE